jgi:hypothetical protein
MLQKRDLIHQVVGLERRVELLRDGLCEGAFEQRRDALALRGDHPAGHVLQIRVGRCDDAFVLQTLQAFAQDKTGLRRKPREALRPLFKIGLRGALAHPATEQIEDVLL